VNHDGLLDIEEMLLMGQNMGIAEQMMRDMFADMDTDNDGQITLKEWVT